MCYFVVFWFAFVVPLNVCSSYSSPANQMQNSYLAKVKTSANENLPPGQLKNWYLAIANPYLANPTWSIISLPCTSSFSSSQWRRWWQRLYSTVENPLCRHISKFCNEYISSTGCFQHVPIRPFRVGGIGRTPPTIRTHVWMHVSMYHVSLRHTQRLH